MTVALLPSSLPQSMTAVRLTVSIPSRELRSGDILFIDPTGQPERADLVVIEHANGRKAIAVFGGAGKPLSDPVTGETQEDAEREQWRVTGRAFARFQRLDRKEAAAETPSKPFG